MGLTATVKAGIIGEYTGSNALGSVSFNILEQTPFDFGDGSGSGNCSKCYSATLTIPASSSTNFDLYGGLTDPLGSVLNFAYVKGLYVRAADSNANNVELGGAAANAWSGIFKASNDIAVIRPGGVFLMHEPRTGWAVTAGTGDILQIANSGAGTAVSFDMIIIGE